MKNCLVCNSSDVDKHHFKTRGAGGTNDEWNLMFLCRKHHVEIHQIGNSSFVEKHGSILVWLMNNNWMFCEVSNKWRHEK